MNKFNAVLNNERFDITALNKNVHDQLSKYLEFDVDKLLYGTDARIFGGAVRDTIANFNIRDIDIMVLPKAAQIIANRIKDLGFLHIPQYSKIDIIQLYDGIKVINAPLTFIKHEHPIVKAVQLIRPRLIKDEDAVEKFHSLLRNVDISACGVTYNKVVEQVCESAIEHCEQKVFEVFKENAMYQRNRILHRIAKLEDRGWKN